MDLIEFLTMLHRSSISYSAINTVKSAVSSFVYLSTNVQLGHNILVHQSSLKGYLILACVTENSIVPGMLTWFCPYNH